MTVIERKRIYEQVYEWLRNAIVGGRFRPGERLIETAIAEELGVSRTPVREAIRMLMNDGLLAPLPTGGVTVHEPSGHEVDDVYECRVALESLAAALAAERASKATIAEMNKALENADTAFAEGNYTEMLEWNIRFHELIVEASGNSHLIRIMRELRAQLLKPLWWWHEPVLKLHLQRGRAFLDEHRSIKDAIEARDAARSEKLMKLHIRNDQQAVLKALQRQQGVRPANGLTTSAD